MKARAALALFALAMPVVMTGCTGWKFYEIESTSSVRSTAPQQSPTVTASPGFQARLASNPRVAVMAPTICLEESHSQGSGINKSKDVLLLSTCGQQMSYIERALLDKGFAVVSWKAISNEMQRETLRSAGGIVVKDTRSALEVAAAMNADVLLVINSLERSYEDGIATDWHRRYFRSDKLGVRGPAIELDENHRLEDVAAFVAELEKTRWSQGPVPSVNLSAVATLVDSGETIWFYEGAYSHTEGGIAGSTYNTKWACDRTGDCKPWGTPAERKRQRDAGENYTVQSDDSPLNYDMRIYDQLVKKIAGDMASNLKYGQRSN